MMTKRLFVMALTAAALLLGAWPAQADLCMTQVNHTDAFEIMGQKQPEKFDTTVMWLGDKWARSDLSDTATMLFSVEKGELTILDHTAKTYTIIPLNFGEIVDQALAEQEGAEADAAKEAMKAMMGSVKCDVQATDETKKIRDWNATKYDVNMSIMMMNMTDEIWATEDIKFDVKAYHAMAEGMLSQMPGASNIVSEMMKIKGIPVLSITTGNMMGTTFTATSEMIECSEKDAPSGWYDIPAGYKEVEMEGMGGF